MTDCVCSCERVLYAQFVLLILIASVSIIVGLPYIKNAIIEHIDKKKPKKKKRGHGLIYKGVDLVSNANVTSYLKNNRPNCIWQWTTVDDEGYPQILIYDFDRNMKYTGWDLIKQKDIKT